MGHFNRDDRRDGGFGNRSFGGGNRDGFGGGRRPMFQAVCSKCGNDCEVPFKPTGARPVFCSNCFEHEGKVSGQRFGGNKFGSKPNFSGGFNTAAKSNEQFKEQFAALNVKLDKILKALSSEIVEPHEETKAIMLDTVEEEKVAKAKSVKKAIAKKSIAKKKK